MVSSFPHQKSNVSTQCLSLSSNKYQSSYSQTAVIDRTALFVAKSANPPQFEDKIRENQRADPKFSFLNPADPYHAYYRHRMDRIAAGDIGDDAAPDKDGKMEGEGEAQPVAAVDIGKEPPTPEFIMDLPNISAIDL